MNPYEAPQSVDAEAPVAATPRNRLAAYGLACAGAGIVSLFLLSVALAEEFTWLTLVGYVGAIVLPPVGVLLCLTALQRPPRRMAVWGLLLGLFGLFHVPTLLLAVGR